MSFRRIPADSTLKLVIEEPKVEQKAEQKMAAALTPGVGSPPGNIAVVRPVAKTKLVILTECDLDSEELKAVYETTDDIITVNDFNCHRTVADLIKKCDVLFVDLTKYLRFYEQSLKTIPPDVLVIKRAVHGLPIRRDSYEGLQVDAVVKYLPDRKRGSLAEYIDALSPHISSHVIYSSSITDRIQVMLLK